MSKDNDHDYQAMLLEDLNISGNPNGLAEYIEKGGKLSPEMRSHIADLIREFVPDKPGASDKKRDFDFYIEVESWIEKESLSEIRKELADFSGDEHEKMLLFFEKSRTEYKKVSNAEAFRHFQDIKGTPNLDVLKKRYERGRSIYEKIFNGRTPRLFGE